MPGRSKSLAGHPLILAHRGASASARENTLEAFRLAVAQDADGIELDVHRTADGVLVVHHDPVVDGVGAVAGTMFDHIRATAPWVPTLEEALPVTGDLLLDIEVKGDPTTSSDAGAVAAQVARWVVDRRLDRRAVVTSFDRDLVAVIRAEVPAVPTGLLVLPTIPVDDAVDRAAVDGHRWVLPHWSALAEPSQPVIDTAHSRGLAVVTWTVDDLGLMRELAGRGVDGIITNDPAAANAALSG